MEATNIDQSRVTDARISYARALAHRTVEAFQADDVHTAAASWAELLRLRALSRQRSLDDSPTRVARLVRAIGR